MFLGKILYLLLSTGQEIACPAQSRIKVSCSRTRRSVTSEAQPLDLESSSLPLSHCAPKISFLDAFFIIYVYIAARDSDLVNLNIAVNDHTHMR